MTDPPFLHWVLRRATRSDAETLTALARMSKASWGYPISWMDAWAPELTITPGYLELHRVTVACGARDIVGMCAIEDHDDHWMLEHVWVSPRVYRRGVGRILVLDALNAAHRRAAVPVRLLADPFAQDFYAHLGAQVTGWTAAPMDGDPGRRLLRMEF
ncbi:MAG TPA: GNAT family N-acetyltransferase [Gemmatimonadaceae bacterium]|nr:GNAT family N-acetyltransferase [Gemmatimonadaceae bacterium]